MEENEKVGLSPTAKKTIMIVAFILAMALIVSIPVAAWFITQGRIAAFAPVSAPEALYIGAGHRDIEHDKFEDIRYLYLEGVDVSEEYFDYVFCVYGKSISGFRLQFAHTTNNQFVYKIYCAEESDTESAGAVAYTTHDETPTTFYYTVDGAPILSTEDYRDALNGQFVDPLILGLNNDSYHTKTYNTYSNVNKFAEPLYWQTKSTDGDLKIKNGILKGDSSTDFVRYFILRIYTNGKESNDRETDIICISAKSFSYSGS